MKVLQILLVFFILLLPLGQFGRIPLAAFQGTIYIHDFVLFFLVLTFFLRALIVERKLDLPFGSTPLIFFVLFALISLVNSLRTFSSQEVLTGSLFLFRFLLYSSLYLVVFNIIKRGKSGFITALLLFDAVLISLLGFLQLIFFFDLSSLSDYGWDPHVGRLVSTFLDPNFLGGFLAFSFSLSLSLVLFKKNPKSFFLLPIIFFMALILTFSRSGYLAWITAALSLAILKSKRLILVFIPIFVVVIILLPRAQERISGAFEIDITAQARIDSWKNALTVASDNIVFGVGYNNYRFAQSKYGFFPVDRPEGGFSGAGADSSLLLVLATTGVFGFLSFITFLGRILIVSFEKRKTSPISLGFFCGFLALLVHSQFVNSLFYPWIMALFFISLGLVAKTTR